MSEHDARPEPAPTLDLAGTFQFPRILGSVTSAVQPARLAIALLMVTALITFGRIWDGVGGPVVPPGGLMDEPVQDTQFVLQSMCIVYKTSADLPRLSSPDWPELDAQEVLLDVEAGYRAMRGTIEGPAARAAEDEMYVANVASIRSVMHRGAFEATSDAVGEAFSDLMRGVVSLSTTDVAEAAGRLGHGIPAALWRDHRLFGIVYGFFTVLVLALGGGALSRMTAAQCATGERIPLRAAVDFSLARPVDLVMTPILPLLIIGAVALLIVILGLLFQLPAYLAWLGGLAYGLALLLGLIGVILALAYVAGFLMLLPAVACENCDAAEAQQRAFAYVLGRPAHLAGYVVVALVGLAVGYFLVSLIAVVLLEGTGMAAALFAGHPPSLAVAGGLEVFDLRQHAVVPVTATRVDALNAEMIEFWQTVVLCFVPAYVVSYLFAASTHVYLLMRRASDGQALDEIWQPPPPAWAHARDRGAP